MWAGCYGCEGLARGPWSVGRGPWAVVSAISCQVASSCGCRSRAGWLLVMVAGRI